MVYRVYVTQQQIINSLLQSEYTGNVVVFSGVGYHNSFILWCGLACRKKESIYYTLSRKKNNKIIRGGTGSSWGHNFYMGTQNGSKHEI